MMPPITSLTTSTYYEEFQHCKQLLHFPEEIALILTDTEHKLFGAIPCGSYVRHVTNPVGSVNQPHGGGGEEAGSKTVRDLILRFREVCDLFTGVMWK